MTSEYYSNGKLLLTGEYVVLEGFEGLALPTVFGQKLSVIITEKKSLIGLVMIIKIKFGLKLVIQSTIMGL